MIDLDTIEMEIRALEARGETTYAQCQRLAWLYTVRDHLLPNEDSRVRLHGSEFLDACNGHPVGQIMAVMDEHMETLRVVQPRVYEATVQKIKELK